MAIIRALRDDDVDRVARLHENVFPPDDGPASLDAYRRYFRETFLDGPRADSGFSSLVCEEPDGRLIGFLGVVPFRMTLAGKRSIWATVCTQFCVDPQRRGIVGLKLVREHLGGRQDLSITDEANPATMRMWKWAGGEAVTSSSMQFMRPLRPARLMLSLAEGRLPFVRRLALPARLVDHLLARVPQAHVRPVQPTTRGMALDVATMTAELPQVAGERRLLPQYEPEALSWYLLRAQAVPDGEVARVLVRDRGGALLGWYIYHRGHDGTAQVLQLAAPAEAAGRVLDHLLYDAWRSDMTVLRGRMDPALAQVYGDRHCLFTRRGPWMVVHSREPALMHMFHRGEALFSSLDGEYSARFRPRAS